MKMINSRKSILNAVFCLALTASLTPAQAYPIADSFPSYMDASSQAGMNQMHDTDYLRDKYQQRQKTEDYQYYEQSRRSGSSSSDGNQVIQNTDPNSAFHKATVEELDTKGVYVNSVEVAPSEILTKEEVNKLVQPLVGKNVFIEDIQKVIDDINNLYAEKGFVTARAFLPEQTVENGNIYIALTESKIGNITVLQNKWTKDGYITRRLPEKEGELFDIVELEKDVLDFNRYNDGVKLSATLKAGEKPGTTDIDLVAEENFPFHLMGVFDNAGRYNTGSLRGGAMIYADSLTGHRDRMSIGSYFSGGAQSPFFDYNFPVNKRDGRIGFMFSSTFADVKWGPYTNLFDINSRAYQYSLYYTQPLIRKTGFELKSYAGINYKRARTSIGLKPFPEIGDMVSTDNITSAEVALMARKDTKYGIWYLSQNAYYSFPIFNSDRDNNYFKYSGSITRLHDFSHGVIGQLRSNYQIVPGDKQIPYLDQMQTGGLVTVRGYNEGLMIGKNGYFISGELMFPLLPREITSPRTGEKIPFIGKYIKGAIFADTAGIFPAASEDVYGGSYFATSVGMGLRVQLPADLTARLYWGFPLIRNYHEDASKMGRFHFEMTLSPNIDALLASRSTKVQPVAPQTQFQKNVEAEYVNNYDDIRHYDYFRDGGGGSL
jgi:hemolysin activation/secretion protein